VGYTPPEARCSRFEVRSAALALSFSPPIRSPPLAQPPRTALVQIARQAFMDLSTNAEFFSNGDWGEAWRKTTFGFRAISAVLRRRRHRLRRLHRLHLLGRRGLTAAKLGDARVG
jgi:hypothetical protein